MNWRKQLLKVYETYYWRKSESGRCYQVYRKGSEEPIAEVSTAQAAAAVCYHSWKAEAA